jgi:hypothetical protein
MDARVLLPQETFDAFATQRNFGLHRLKVASLMIAGQPETFAPGCHAGSKT